MASIYVSTHSTSTALPHGWRLVPPDNGNGNDALRLTALELFQALEELTHAVKQRERILGHDAIITEQINAVKALIDARAKLWSKKYRGIDVG